VLIFVATSRGKVHPDFNAIIRSIRSNCDKDAKAYKITEYYCDFISGILDEGGIVLARTKVLSIEKELRRKVKKNPNKWTTIMQPEESALFLINYLRDKGFLK